MKETATETTAQIKYAAGLKITLQTLQVQLRYGAAWFLVSPNMALVLPVGTVQYITQGEFYQLRGTELRTKENFIINTHSSSYYFAFHS